jgi:hypothetical protein
MTGVTFGAAKVRLTVLAGLVGLLAAGRAYAQATPCQTDVDCPGTACGGQVCIKSSGGSMCADANTVGASGAGDGWCANGSGTPVDTNCKCRAQGATCDGFSCTFTIPPDGGTTGTGGTGGGGTGGSGAGGAGTAGSTGTGGSGTGGSGSSGTSGGGGGGCSVAGAPSTFGAVGAALLLGIASLRMRRRRSRRRA